MPSPTLLASRLEQAVAAGDAAAFARWSSHPRFRSDHYGLANCATAALRRPDAPMWLDRLVGLGAPSWVLSLDSPLICAAVHAACPSAVAWCLARGESPHRREGVGMGPSAAASALKADNPAMLVEMFQAQGRVMDLLLPDERRLWLAAEALPGLMALVQAGWDPDATEPGQSQSFTQWVQEDPRASVPVRDFATQYRLNQVLPPATAPALRPRM